MADVLRLWLPVCPATPDVVLAGALPFANAALGEGRSGLAGLLDSLRLHEVPLRPVVLTTMALALAPDSSDVRLVAVDTVGDAAADGRVDGAGLGDVVGDLVPARVVKVNRVAASLDGVARAGALATARVAEVVERILGRTGAAGGRDLHLLMTVVGYTLAAQGASVTDRAAAEAVAAIAGRKGTTKAIAEARRLHALAAGRSTALRREAVAASLDARLRRVDDEPVRRTALTGAGADGGVPTSAVGNE